MQDAFIGFGGNVVREKVKAGAAWYIYSMEELIEELGENSGAMKVVSEATFNGVLFSYDAGRRVVGMGTSPTLAAN